MENIRKGKTEIRQFILENIGDHPSDIVKLALDEFGCTRQAINKHLQRLIFEHLLTESGNTRNKKYELAVLERWEKSYPLDSRITEDQAWREDVAPALGALPENVLAIWHYGFTEIFNNAIDHSNATEITVEFEKNAVYTVIVIYDNGIGIFKKIQSALDLLDERHAVLELAKGKFTTDPKNHSGEGIFFSSRVFDYFSILSGEVYFSHRFNQKEDWINQTRKNLFGTCVSLELKNQTVRTLNEIFDKFTDDENYGFNKTIVPVELALYGDDNLVSRSQAKRMLTRIEKFKVVVFDFTGVTSIGQAFADEIFRVFARQHPEIEITDVNTSAEVSRMISRAKVHAN